MSTSNLSATEKESPRKSWAMWPFAVSISVATILTFVQSVFVGAFLGGNVASLDAHRMTGMSLAVVFLLVLVASIIARSPGRGPIWPFYSSLVLIVLIGFQIVLGFSGRVELHVPLGVLIVALSALLTLQSWRLIHRPAGALAS